MQNKPRLQISIDNQEKYGKPPTWPMIEAFIKKVGMKMYAFERFYGMPYNSLTQIKSYYYNPSSKVYSLGSSYWHYIYEEIIPEYGVKYKLVEIDKIQEIEPTKPRKILKKKKVAKIVAIENDIHGRLNKIK